MVHKRNGQCIFSCDNKKCINDSTETFKDVICPHHLSQVFGLKVAIDKYEKESTDYYVGPFLILDDSFSFEPNTVVFPDRDFVDQDIGIKEPAEVNNFYKYKMNPRMRDYLSSLQSNDFNLTSSEIRYQVEIIRNLFFVSDDKDGKNLFNFINAINLAKGTEDSNKSLIVELKTRFQQLQSTIQTEDYNNIFKNISVLDINNNDKTPLTNFTPFMRFMIFNCLLDDHKLPITGPNAIGITCYLNLIYVKGIGLVTTQEILNPSHLVVSGSCTGNNNFYQLKVRPIHKRTVPKNNVYKRSLADNVRSSNVLNPQSDFCWKR